MTVGCNGATEKTRKVDRQNRLDNEGDSGVECTVISILVHVIDRELSNISHLQLELPPLLQNTLRRGCPRKGAWHAHCGKDYGILQRSCLLQSRQDLHNI